MIPLAVFLFGIERGHAKKFTRCSLLIHGWNAHFFSPANQRTAFFRLGVAAKIAKGTVPFCMHTIRHGDCHVCQFFGCHKVARVGVLLSIYRRIFFTSTQINNKLTQPATFSRFIDSRLIDRMKNMEAHYDLALPFHLTRATNTNRFIFQTIEHHSPFK